MHFARLASFLLFTGSATEPTVAAEPTVASAPSAVVSDAHESDLEVTSGVVRDVDATTGALHVEEDRDGVVTVDAVTPKDAGVAGALHDGDTVLLYRRDGGVEVFPAG